MILCCKKAVSLAITCTPASEGSTRCSTPAAAASRSKCGPSLPATITARAPRNASANAACNASLGSELNLTFAWFKCPRACNYMTSQTPALRPADGGITLICRDNTHAPHLIADIACDGRHVRAIARDGLLRVAHQHPDLSPAWNR